jgi:hypothetical protein
MIATDVMRWFEINGIGKLCHVLQSARQAWAFCNNIANPKAFFKARNENSYSGIFSAKKIVRWFKTKLRKIYEADFE